MGLHSVVLNASYRVGAWLLTDRFWGKLLNSEDSDLINQSLDGVIIRRYNSEMLESRRRELVGGNGSLRSP